MFAFLRETEGETIVVAVNPESRPIPTRGGRATIPLDPNWGRILRLVPDQPGGWTRDRNPAIIASNTRRSSVAKSTLKRASDGSDSIASRAAGAGSAS